MKRRQVSVLATGSQLRPVRKYRHYHNISSCNFSAHSEALGSYRACCWCAQWIAAGPCVAWSVFVYALLASAVLGQDHHGYRGSPSAITQPHRVELNRTLSALSPVMPQPGERYVPPSQLPSPPRAKSITGQPSPSAVNLTMEALISIAEANNPTLRQAAMHIDASLGRAIQAGLYPNPLFRYSAELIGVGGSPGEFQGGILSQEIVRGKKLQLSQAKFLERVKIAEANAVAQQFRVCNDIRIHFFSVLAWQNRWAAQQELVKSSEDMAVTAREAHNMGQANAADIHRADAVLQKERLKLLRSENKLLQEKRTISALIGVDVSDSTFAGQLEGEPLAIDFDALLAELWANSPELMAARAKARSDHITIRRELAEPISNLKLEGGIGYNFETNETVGVAGVSLPLSINDRNQGTIRQARADLARQYAEIDRIRQELRLRLAREFESYSTAVQHVEQYQHCILPDLKETYRLLLESYKNNRTNWNHVLSAQSDYFASRIEYFSWLEQFRRSQVLIDGMLLRGGLEAARTESPPGHIDAVAKPR